MKKIKIFILSLFFVALGTVGAVAGFYVNENSTAVVNWLNNSVNVSNDNYKQLFEESKLTTMQLNLQIARLEEENSQLQIEKEQLNSKITELEQGSEEDKALIEEYKLQVADLNSQIEEKDLMIAELQELVNSIYQELVEEILVLPDELQDKELDYYGFGNDFLVAARSYGLLYEFNYDEGTLNLVYSKIEPNCMDYLKQVPNGYLFIDNDGSTKDIYFYNKSTKQSSCLIANSQRYSSFDDDNGSFLFTSKGMYYFDYATTSATQYYTGSLEFVRSNIYEDEDCFVFNLCTANSVSKIYSIYFNKQNKTCFKVNLDLGTQYGASYFTKYFRLKNSLYCAIGRFYSSGTLGLYRINETDSTSELVYAFDSQTAGMIADTFVNENTAVFGFAKNIYSFDGETVSVVIDSASNAVSQRSTDSILIAETEAAEYYSNTGTSYIFKYNKETSEVTLINMGNLYVSSALINENSVVIIRKSGVSILDLSTDAITDFTSGTFDKVYVIGDNFYLLYNYSSQYTMYAYSCSTLELVGTAKNYAVTDYMDYGTAVVFYSDTYYTIFSPNSTVYGVNVACRFDLELSDLSERTFYVKTTTLTDGTLYAKLVYNEDFTEFTRSLLLVK